MYVCYTVDVLHLEPPYKQLLLDLFHRIVLAINHHQVHLTERTTTNQLPWLDIGDLRGWQSHECTQWGEFFLNELDLRLQYGYLMWCYGLIHILRSAEVLRCSNATLLGGEKKLLLLLAELASHIMKKRILINV